MIDNPDRAVVIGVAAATVRARAAAFAAGAAAIREGQASVGAGEAIHDQARAIADRTSLLPTPTPTKVSGGEYSGFDQGPNAVDDDAWVDEVYELEDIDAAEGAFDISSEAADVADFVEIDVIEIII